MIESRGGAGLALEASQAFFVPAERGGQQLKRDFATQLGILGQKNFAHAALPQQRENLVMSNWFSDDSSVVLNCDFCCDVLRRRTDEAAACFIMRRQQGFDLLMQGPISFA